MNDEAIAKAQSLLDAGEEVEVDGELAAALGVSGIEGDGTTIAVLEDEADRAIRGFAEQLTLEAARESLLQLLDAPYERKLEFIESDEWVVVAPIAAGRSPQKHPNCVKLCEVVCQTICKQVCKTVCRKVPGGKIICEPVCRIACRPVCKKICQMTCH